MIGWLRKRRQPIFVATVAVFLVGIFAGLGGYYFYGADTADAIAIVGSTKIPSRRFDVRVNQILDALRERGEVSEEKRREVRFTTARDMIVEELLAMQAGKLGLRVTDMELAAHIRGTPRFQRDGAFEEALYFQAVRMILHTTPEDYELQLRRSLEANKLKGLLFESAKLSPQEIRDEYVRAKGSDKGFDKEGDAFAESLRQTRAIDLINVYLRQVVPTVNIQNLVERREQGQ